MEYWALVMFAVVIGLLLLGYPVAFTIGGVALLFGLLFLGIGFLDLLPLRIWGIVTNFNLLAVPLFVLMGVVLERTGIARDMLETIGRLFGGLRGGMAVAVVVVGALLAATTGVIGATVVAMGVIALPVMLRHGYSPRLASGTIVASGALGQIVPPSIVLILLADVLGLSPGRLFMAAVAPGLILVLALILFVLVVAWLRPQLAPPVDQGARPTLGEVAASLLPVLLLMALVLGSILFGVATPTEAAGLGALGAIGLGLLRRRLKWVALDSALRETLRLTAMVFFVLIGATAFSLVFTGMGGDWLVHDLFEALPGGPWGFLLLSMALLFVLGMFLDFIEICFLVVPILGPVAVALGIDPLWFAVLIALNLQTSFLTPPFGFALFYLKAVARDLEMATIYRGALPFIALQLTVLGLVLAFPGLIHWLPGVLERWH